MQLCRYGAVAPLRGGAAAVAVIGFKITATTATLPSVSLVLGADEVFRGCMLYPCHTIMNSSPVSFRWYDWLVEITKVEEDLRSVP